MLFFRIADEATAREVVTRRDAGLVLMCGVSSEARLYLDGSKRGPVIGCGRCRWARIWRPRCRTART